MEYICRTEGCGNVLRPQGPVVAFFNATDSGLTQELGKVEINKHQPISQLLNLPKEFRLDKPGELTFDKHFEGAKSPFEIKMKTFAATETRYISIYCYQCGRMWEYTYLKG